MTGIPEISDESFERAVLEANRPVVLDFWAPWCGPCKAIAPIMEDLARAHDHVTFARLNIDENPATGARYNVLSIPTVVLFDGGEPRETLVGARSRRQYEEAWAPWLRATP